MAFRKRLNRLAYCLDLKTHRTWQQFFALRAIYYRDLWQQAAAINSASCSQWHSNFLRIERNGMATFVNLSRIMLDDHLTLEIFGNKGMTYELLDKKDCHIPSYRLIDANDTKRAIEFFDSSSKRIVIKPAVGTGGGRGVTNNITSVEKLKQAIRRAARHSTKLLIEEHIDGDSYRLLYLNGQFIDAIRRESPCVIGDGKSRLRKLIENECRQRLRQKTVRALSPLLIDDDCRLELSRQGMSLNTVPGMGQQIKVKHAVNENTTQENHQVSTEVHKDIIELGARLSKELNISFAGLDIITTDITVPLEQSGGVINEINTTPGIHHHYLISSPENATPVAQLLLEYMFNSHDGVIYP